MKKGIHPENYRTVLFYDSNAKQGFLIRSCAKTNNTMKWEDYHQEQPAEHQFDDEDDDRDDWDEEDEEGVEFIYKP